MGSAVSLGPRRDAFSRVREAAARVVARPFFFLLALLARLMPRSALLRLAAGCSRGVFRLFPGIRAALLDNAAHILGPAASPAERRRFAVRVLESFSRFLVELVAPARRIGQAPEQDLGTQTSGREHFEAAAAAGRGIIAATLHMGNYELASMELAALRPNVAIVFNRERIRFLERIRSRRRRAKNLEEIVIDSSRFFAVEALRRLREGGIILLAGDQVEARDGEHLPFLHGTASFSIWPARLAAASGAPILPAFNVRDADGRYRLHLEPPIFPEGREPLEILMELVRVFERYVRDHSEQWLMIRRFWV